MLMDILMESLMSMDEDTLDSVLESCDTEELEIIDNAVMEMKIADRNNPNVQEYLKTMKELRRPGAKTGTTAYNGSGTKIRYNGANGSISSTDKRNPFGTTNYKKYDETNKEFVKQMKAAVKRDTMADNAANFVTNVAKQTANNVRNVGNGVAKNARAAGEFLANDAKQTVSDIQNTKAAKLIDKATNRAVADVNAVKSKIKKAKTANITKVANSLRNIADKISD